MALVTLLLLLNSISGKYGLGLNTENLLLAFALVDILLFILNVKLLKLTKELALLLIELFVIFVL